VVHTYSKGVLRLSINDDLEIVEGLAMTAHRRIEFDAAHFLPNYDGKCRNLHGHRWTVEIGVRDFVDPNTGMVADFTLLKRFLKLVEETFDHKCVNDVIPLPTAENIAEYTVNLWSTATFDDGNRRFRSLGDLRSVRVWETPDCYIEWHPGV
jgi:6-pyruvoyltetrahydropterin/6-carboxytetrahydropterin synthase